MRMRSAGSLCLVSVFSVMVALAFGSASSVVTSSTSLSGEASSPAAPNSPLEKTYWKLIELDGQAVNTTNARMEPHIVLDSKTHRLSGAGGCNQVAGNYELKDNSLNFDRVVSSMLACKPGFDLENRFLSALRETRSWKIAGGKLDLCDADGKLLARFEAQAAK